MTQYLEINKEKELFFPFNTPEDTVDLLFKNNLTNRIFEISLLKLHQTNRGFLAKVICTGKEHEPYFEIDDTFNTTTLNISSGDYNVTGEDAGGVARIISLHIIDPQKQETYKTDNSNIVYNG